MDAEERRCKCGHREVVHHPAGRCDGRMAFDWDDDLKVHTRYEPCDCRKFVDVNPPPASPTGCPHELLPLEPNCVICGKPVPPRALSSPPPQAKKGEEPEV